MISRVRKVIEVTSVEKLILFCSDTKRPVKTIPKLPVQKNASDKRASPISETKRVSAPTL